MAPPKGQNLRVSGFVGAGEGGLSVGWDDSSPWLCHFTSGVTLGKSIFLYETQFSHLQNGELLPGSE